jgi:glycosyltransferase involved in cell wall biosynthesis
LLNVKVLFWVLDLYPDAVWCGTNIKEKNIVLSFWKLVNKCSFKKADFIISLSNTMIKETKKYLPSSDQNKFVQIPTWVDPEKFYPLDRKKNPLLTELNLAGKFIVLYSGNIGATHDLNFLPELANSLKSHKNIVFLIVGSGSGLKNLTRKACCCNNVAFLPPQPFESLNNLLSLGHIAIVSQKYGTGGVSMPSKTYYYMACGCAIMGVVPLDSGVKDVVREYKCGFCCGHADITKMKNFILNCRHKRSILEKFSNNSRLAVEKRFNLEKCSKKFIQLISRL